METCKIKNLYNLKETRLQQICLRERNIPGKCCQNGAFIKELGSTLSEEEYEKRGETVWVAKSAKVAPTAFLGENVIIGKNAEVRHCAFIRGNAIVGEGAVVGNSTELKTWCCLIKYRFLITTM